ncbi:hypothetical protein [Desulfobotulus mexicanus]|uniref:Uncharacterized protein n=1 Tax=Desulfobotulus mexicanus TaxID=2586642 RepID=A0A5S5ME52_9BACT|nr:hypothetical protein [Desulfobotulus mexicanus]TYT73984.1 hypothetical protein FIM25_12545 [Desulfobotulus mexicanus]
MDTCPACKAKTAEKTTCHRCKLDLQLFLDVEKEAENHAIKARQAHEKKDMETLYIHSSRWVSLKASPEACRLLAISALHMQNYPKALMAQKMAARLSGKYSDTQECRQT